MLRTFVRRFGARLRGGTLHFNEAERTVLAAVLDRLSQSDARVLSEQIKQVSLVQRQHPGKLVAAYYSSRSEVPALPYAGYEYCLANVTYKSPSGGSKTTSVVLHDSKLMSLERNVPQRPEEIGTIISVKLHPRSYTSPAAAIDGEEHGGAA